ncbi:MAG: GTP cyclohydrolase I [Sandaracinaceae bacterium]|nr:GTP cyclohydrolase I [Sandaracinaceae bacterium]
MPDRDSAARHIRAFLEAVGAPIGIDPELKRTPERVADAWIDEFLRGYRMDPKAILSERTTSVAKGLIVVRELPVTIMCPHHLLPSWGVVHVGYWPGPYVVGFGAIAQLVECFARRLILQEDFVNSITQALITHLQAEGAAAMAMLAPSCLRSRGERAHCAEVVTLSFAGCAQAEKLLQQEFMLAVQQRSHI